MLDLGFVLLLAVWSAGVGLSVVRRLGPLPEHPADALALALPVGLGGLGLASLGLGEVGRLDARAIGFVLCAGSLPLFAGRWWVALRLPTLRSGDGIDRAFAAALGIALAGTLLTALTPVTDGDALCYHLQVPKRFLAHGSVFFDPDLHETVYPLLTEMVFIVALAFRGPVACRLVSWLLGVVLALNVAALARPVLGRRAWWAATVALLVPAVSNGMSAPLNDVALAAFGTAALHAWARLRDRPSLRGAALTGLLTGLAMGVKYPALVLAGLIGLTIAPGFIARVLLRLSAPGSGRMGNLVARLVATATRTYDAESRPRRRLTQLVAFALVAWAVGGVWYVRALVHTGNPVHPFFRQTFGGAGLDEVLGPEKRPLPVDTWHVLTALGPMTLDPDRFDSVSHEFGPVFLFFLPALLLERPPLRVLATAAIGFAFLALCLTQRQSMRFVLTAVGPLSVGVAWLAQTWWERRSRPGVALVAVLTVVLAFQSALAVARVRHGAKVLLGFESADDYLARREPTFRVGRWVDAHLPATARLVGQDHRGYYLPRDYTMELAHRRRTGLGSRGESADEIVGTLLRSGFTHLMLCPPVPETAVEFDPTLGHLLAPWLAGRAPLYRHDLSDADGVVRRYAIYDLGDAPRLATRGGETLR
jgi:hypothetical protein